MTHKNGFFILLAAVSFVVSLFIATTNTQNTSAASLANWDAGRIIDDDVFTASGSMTAAQIQSFLNSKVPFCDTYGTKPSEYGGGTRAQWGQANYGQSTFTCLKDYQEGGKSSAQIIYDAAQEFTINPQVIIVLLQKEQGLVTDEWPLNIQYRSATGYGCPDTAPCDTQYYGLTNQVRWAARMFRAIMNASPTWYTPYVVGNNYIRYSPVSSCGGSVVNIFNRSTQALYNYTPYQPNQGALDAGYGTAPCGAYGNRNFYHYFNDWFGPSVGPAYKSQFFAQSSSSIDIFSGETKYLWVKFKNVGRIAWGDDVSALGFNPVHVATYNPINRTSLFSQSWPQYNRSNFFFEKVYEADGVTLAANQHVVANGQVAEFKIPLTAPIDIKPGTYKEDFSIIREGASDWWLGPNIWVSLNVQPTYNATFHSQNTYSTSLRENEAQTVYFQYKNTGNATWYDDVSLIPGQRPVHLATSSPINTPSKLGASWFNPSRPAMEFSAVFEADGVTLAANQHIVQPGQIGRFEFTISHMIGSSLPASTILAVQPILEGAPIWDMGGHAWARINTASGVVRAEYHSQSNWPTIAKGTTQTLFFAFRNNGDTAWRDNVSNVRGVMPIHLASTSPINRTSILGSAWINLNRPAVNLSSVYEADGVTLAANQHVVQPGQIGRFNFTISVPVSAPSGIYTETFQPVAEGAPGTRWNMGATVFTRVTVP